MFIDRFGNGVVIRPVFFNGKRWQHHRVAGGPNRGHQFASVFATEGQRWPRTFSTHRTAHRRV